MLGFDPVLMISQWFKLQQSVASRKGEKTSRKQRVGEKDLLTPWSFYIFCWRKGGMQSAQKVSLLNKVCRKCLKTLKM